MSFVRKKPPIKGRLKEIQTDVIKVEKNVWKNSLEIGHLIRLTSELKTDLKNLSTQFINYKMEHGVMATKKIIKKSFSFREFLKKYWKLIGLIAGVVLGGLYEGRQLIGGLHAGKQAADLIQEHVPGDNSLHKVISDVHEHLTS